MDLHAIILNQNTEAAGIEFQERTLTGDAKSLMGFDSAVLPERIDPDTENGAIEITDGNKIVVNIEGLTNEETAPTDDDYLVISRSGAIKKLKYSNVKSLWRRIDNDPVFTLMPKTSGDDVDIGVGTLYADDIEESSADFGVTIEGLTIKDSALELGSDAAYDLYFRNTSGETDRLGVGAEDQVLGVSSNALAWINQASSLRSWWLKELTHNQAQVDFEDDTAWTEKNSIFNGGSAPQNYYLSVGFTDGKPRGLGMLSAIGGDSTISGATAPDWTSLRGVVAVINAEDGSWFHIENSGTGDYSGDDYLQPTRTGMAEDIYFVSKAMFVYTQHGWLLVSYSPLKKWFKSYPISAASGLNHTIDIPVNFLPFNGYYHIDVFIEFQCLDSNDQPVGGGESLSVTDYDNTKSLDSCAGIIATGTTTVVIQHGTMQGSTHVRVEATRCSDRYVSLEIVLVGDPTKTQILSGRVDFHFLGKNIGDDCNAFS
jgi:hypothetical protein